MCPDAAIHFIRFLLITSIFEDVFVPERMFASVIINMFELLVSLLYHFMMNKAYYFAFNTPSQNDITIHQSNHFSEKEQLIQTPDDSRKFNCRQHLTNKMYNPDRCCQVRKTKGNREHRDEFNIATSKGN